MRSSLLPRRPRLQPSHRPQPPSLCFPKRASRAYALQVSPPAAQLWAASPPSASSAAPACPPSPLPTRPTARRVTPAGQLTVSSLDTKKNLTFLLCTCYFSYSLIPVVRSQTPSAPNERSITNPPVPFMNTICIKIPHPHSLCSCFLSLPELLPSYYSRSTTATTDLELQIYKQHVWLPTNTCKRFWRGFFCNTPSQCNYHIVNKTVWHSSLLSLSLGLEYTTLWH